MKNTESTATFLMNRQKKKQINEMERHKKDW